MTSKAERLTTCPSCQTVNPEFEAFCQKCGAPIGRTATLDPMNVIQAEGHLFRKAIEGRPKPIVLIGIWVAFFPALVGSAGIALVLVVKHENRADFVFFWCFVGLSYMSFVILYRVTRNYLTIPAKGQDAEDEGEHDPRHH